MRLTSAYLRLERHGDEVTGAASADGKQWGPVGHGDKPVRVRLPKKVQVGVFAASTSIAAVKVTFDQFKLTPLKGGAKGGPAVRVAPD
jgi:regulation of enolase protein 1 (concanavalin A-like superfamily)